MSPTADRAKIAAAERALGLIEPGMRLGLGSGSTAEWFVRLLGRRAATEDLALTCVATSEATAALARECGIATVPLEAAGRLDLSVDGADEIDPALDLIKGGGGALLREKIVAHASTRRVIIADAAKQVGTLGAFPLPVEIVRFGWPLTQAAIEAVLDGADVAARQLAPRMAGSEPIVTDEGHVLLDLALGRIGAPGALARALAAIPGVVEHGLFLGMADVVIIGREDGSTACLARADADPALPGRDALTYADELMRSLDA